MAWLKNWGGKPPSISAIRDHIRKAADARAGKALLEQLGLPPADAWTGETIEQAELPPERQGLARTIQHLQQHPRSLPRTELNPEFHANFAARSTAVSLASARRGTQAFQHQAEACLGRLSRAASLRVDFSLEPRVAVLAPGAPKAVHVGLGKIALSDEMFGSAQGIGACAARAKNPEDLLTRLFKQQAAGAPLGAALDTYLPPAAQRVADAVVGFVMAHELTHGLRDDLGHRRRRRLHSRSESQVVQLNRSRTSSRGGELAADFGGTLLLVEAGYSPLGLLFLANLAIDERLNGTRVTTHPPADKRYARAYRQLQERLGNDSTLPAAAQRDFQKLPTPEQLQTFLQTSVPLGPPAEDALMKRAEESDRLRKEPSP